MNKINDLFDVVYGNGYEFIKLKKSDNGSNFIARTSKNNGVVGKVTNTNVEPFDGGSITVSLGGSVLETFLQDEPFYTAFHIFVLIPKKKMSNIEKIYYCAAINLNKYRYNYGRQANRTLSNLIIPKFDKKDLFANFSKELLKNYHEEINNMKKLIISS